MALAWGALADPAALLRIEMLGPDAQVTAIEAEPGDILSVEDAPGLGGRFGLTVRLVPQLDDPVARLTQGRDGDTVVVKICGQEMLRAVLRGEIPSARFTLSLQDRAVRWAVRTALTGGGCASVVSS
ncbi:MAG: hypothetical protein ACK4L4_18280 [Gemmobacter sp.]